MKRVDPPFLELGFYFADLEDADALARLCGVLLAAGARFAGAARGHRGPGARRLRFAGVTDSPLPGPLSLAAGSLPSALEHPDLRIVELDLLGAVGLGGKRAEVLGHTSISRKAAPIDHHPLVILTSGEAFSGPPGQSPERGFKEGGLVYGRMRHLVEAVRPAYATITVEQGLCCPTDLADDLKTSVFIDFYVSEGFLGSEALQRIARRYVDAYQERMADGLYVSCSSPFNPDRRALPYEIASRLSPEVAKLIARRALRAEHGR